LLIHQIPPKPSYQGEDLAEAQQWELLPLSSRLRSPEEPAGFGGFRMDSKEIVEEQRASVCEARFLEG